MAELETQILLSVELGYLNRDPENDLLVKLDTIGKMLRGLHKSLNKKEKM